MYSSCGADKMRKIIIFLLSSVFIVCNFVHAASYGVVQVCGESNLGTVEGAIENAKYVAVKTASYKFLQKVDSTSWVMFIQKNYKKYLNPKQKIKVMRKKKIGNTMKVFCNVEVDYAAIQRDIVSSGRAAEKHTNGTVGFFVNINGLTGQYQNGDLKSVAGHFYKTAFGSTFGLKVEDHRVLGNDQSSFGSFKNAVLNEARNLKFGDLKFLIVAHIVITKVSGGYAEGCIEAECVTQEGKILGQYSKMFAASERDEKKAVELLIQKASINSSKYLADVTYKTLQFSKR